MQLPEISFIQFYFCWDACYVIYKCLIQISSWWALVEKSWGVLQSYPTKLPFYSNFDQVGPCITLFGCVCCLYWICFLKTSCEDDSQSSNLSFFLFPFLINLMFFLSFSRYFLYDIILARLHRIYFDSCQIFSIFPLSNSKIWFFFSLFCKCCHYFFHLEDWYHPLCYIHIMKSICP